MVNRADQPDDSTHSRPWHFNIKVLSVVLFVVFAALAGVIVLVSDTRLAWMRLVGVAILFFVVLLALLDNVVETGRKERAWRQLANRAGLSCRVEGLPLLGYTVSVSGTFQNRWIALDTFKQGKSQVPSTRIELQVKNSTGASLRLRGPFNPNSANFDVGVSGLFQASDARQFGDKHRFFIRSHPLHLVTNLYNAQPVRNQLSHLETLINIELEDNKLQFDSLGVLGDVDFLHNMFKLLSDLANIVEHGSHTKFSVPSNSG